MAETHKRIFQDTTALSTAGVFVLCVGTAKKRASTSWWWKNVNCEKCRRLAPARWRRKWETER
jgi:hypothetical protein